MDKTSNNKNTIVVPISFSNQVMQELAENYEVRSCSQDSLNKQTDLLSLCEGADALCPVFYQNLDNAFIQALPKSIKLIASYGVGTNHIDLAAAKDKGIQVSNTPDVVTNDTADLTLGLIIAAMRGFYQSEKDLRGGNWGAPSLFARVGYSLSGKTLGIIGLGRIGCAVAIRAQAFGMNVIYYSRSPHSDKAQALGVQRSKSLEELLTQSDVVSLHCDLNPQTHHIINEESLSKMKKSATLINTGRGPLIDEDALVEALRKKQIASAGLDVFEFEPKIAQGLTELANVTLLPHIGTATHETRDAMGRRVKANLDHYFTHGAPLDPCV